MKKNIGFLVLLLGLLLLIPSSAAAYDDTITVVSPGDTFELTLSVSSNPNYVATAFGKLDYDHDVFELIPSDVVQNDDDVGFIDSTGLQIGYPLDVTFRVLPDAPEGEYAFNCKLTTQKDVNSITTNGLKIGTRYVNVVKSSSRPKNVYSTKVYGFQSYVGVEVSFSANGQIEWVRIGENEDFDEERGVILKHEHYVNLLVGKTPPLSLDDIDGYTGATVTANAVITALNQAYEQTKVANKEKEYVKTVDDSYMIWAGENSGNTKNRVSITRIYPFPRGRRLLVLPRNGISVVIYTQLITNRGYILYRIDINNPLIVIGEAMDSSGVKWFQVRFKGSNGQDIIGFVKADDVSYYQGWLGTSNFFMPQYTNNTVTASPTPNVTAVINTTFDVYVQSFTATLWSAPSFESSKIIVLQQGTKMTVLGQVHGADGRIWYYVTCGDKTGYIPANLVTTTPPAPTSLPQLYEQDDWYGNGHGAQWDDHDIVWVEDDHHR
ncbi:MAG: FMN-binding protein [Clostridia bacterium]|nr:FMN-binding protein [Clostridia bacterium]